ncbi:hypothetical protein PYW08_003222 [Mythimna loreyi]|uniref:Uncharacterized protein n=1 Tax=Mythimna loreyi TaxID=667449 RepID=A0ACC2QUR4_9NEOP|nr:hypothetical protein PYW08_003222 [Mythimna loreyi]
MKLTALFLMLMAVLTLFASAGEAAPRPDPSIDLDALKKTGQKIKQIVSAVCAAATVHETYQSAKKLG